MPIPMPIIASDMTITSTSIVSGYALRRLGHSVRPPRSTLCTGRAQVAVNEFTCLSDRRQHHRSLSQRTMPVETIVFTHALV